MFPFRSVPCIALAGWLAATTSARLVLADERVKTGTLSWSQRPGAEGCIDSVRLRSRVEGQLGRAVFVDSGRADLAITGFVEPARDQAGTTQGFHAAIVAKPASLPSSTREVRSTKPECEALDEAIVLVVALTIDPNAVAPPTPVPTPVPPPLIAESTPAPTPPSPSWHPDARLTGGVLIGLLPEASPGGSLVFTVTPPRFIAIGLGVGAWAPEHASATDGGVDLSLVEAAASACPELRLSRRIRLSPCLGIGAGAIIAQGTGFTSTHGLSQAVADLRGGVRVDIDVAGPIFLTLGGAAVVPFVRPHFTYTADRAQHDVYDLPPVAALFDVGVGWRFR